MMLSLAGLAAIIVLSLTLHPKEAAAAPRMESAEFIGVAADGALSLAADAPSFGAFRRFGSFVSAPQRLATPTTAIAVSYDASLTPGSQVLLDLRVSPDGQHWSQWRTGLGSGQIVQFAQPASFAQYRALLFAVDAAPSLRRIALTAEAAAPQTLDGTTPPVAPTFKVHVTRQGMVGGRTANGHIITKNDYFVSLPCWCALNKKGETNYSVRLTANGRSVVVPVWDVGPWNTKDNYWDPSPQRTFSDLRQGYPQDHAAFYDGYNGGVAAKGKVKFPTAIDIGDGAFRELGLGGARGQVEATFLWMGTDPLAAAPPAAPAAPEPTAAPAAPEPTAAPAAPAAPEPTAKPPEPTAKPPEPTAKPPEPTAKPPEPTAKPPEPTAKPPEPTAKSPEPTAKPPEPTAKPTTVAPTAQPTAPPNGKKP